MFGLGKNYYGAPDKDWTAAQRTADLKRAIRARKKILDRLVASEETVRTLARRIARLEEMLRIEE